MPDGNSGSNNKSKDQQSNSSSSSWFPDWETQRFVLVKRSNVDDVNIFLCRKCAEYRKKNPESPKTAKERREEEKEETWMLMRSFQLRRWSLRIPLFSVRMSYSYFLLCICFRDPNGMYKLPLRGSLCIPLGSLICLVFFYF